MIWQLNKSARPYVYNGSVIRLITNVHKLISINVFIQIIIPILMYCRIVVLMY
jgi:hypothetical protein